MERLSRRQLLKVDSFKEGAVTLMNAPSFAIPQLNQLSTLPSGINAVLESKINRRSFIKGVTLAGAGVIVVATGCESLNTETELPEWMPPVANEYWKVLNEELKPYPNLDPVLLSIQLLQESGFDKFAVSSAGAQGLAQIMPDTGDWIALQLGLRNYDIFEPKTNLKFMAYYDNFCSKKKGPGASMLWGYHDGPGATNISINGNMYIENIMGMYAERNFDESAKFEKWLNSVVVNSNARLLRAAFGQQGRSFDDWYASRNKNNDASLSNTSDKHRNNSDSVSSPNTLVSSCYDLTKLESYDDFGNQNVPDLDSISPGDRFIMPDGSIHVVTEGDWATRIWDKYGNPHSMKYCK